MMWLFLQVFLYCLLSFLLGVLATWFFLVRPRRGQGAATGSPAADAGSPPPAAGSGTAEPDGPGDRTAAPAGAASGQAAPVGVGGSGDLTGDAGDDPVAAGSAATAAAPDRVDARGDRPGPDGAASGRAGDQERSVEGAPAAAAPSPAAAVPDHDPATTTGAAAEPVAAATATALAEPGPYGEGSAKALPDGSAPSDDYTIKGNADSMLYHTTRSPYFGRTKAEVWFRTESDAQRGGFTAWNRRRKRSGS